MTGEAYLRLPQREARHKMALVSSFDSTKVLASDGALSYVIGRNLACWKKLTLFEMPDLRRETSSMWVVCHHHDRFPELLIQPAEQC
jgi:hypothetical protein